MSSEIPCRVLIVDDSAVVRQMLTEILSRAPGIEVVGSAADPILAREKIKRLNPDVITLDVEMPRMDGLAFLENLMRLRPTPVVMISSLTERGADTTLQALALGAVDFISKPKLDVARGLEEYAEEIIGKVKAAAKAKVRALDRPAAPRPAGNAVAAPSAVSTLKFRTTDRLIAIGASAGGTEALRVVLEGMPADAPAVVMTQHLPAGFSTAFADRLNRHSAMAVREASEGEAILPGHAYLPPGGKHLQVVRDGARWRCKIDDGPPVNRHKPAVDVLFQSVARNAGANAIGAVLTGMGDDGARGLLEMLQAGASTLVQDEATSVVWGMPGSAFRLGAAQEVLPLDRIAERLIALSNQAR
ncbi:MULTISPECIES: protein-glutamate methylesterase/protein-glutamine glutaminase [Xanthomonas translucens group]|jgi:two-component system chemotaxis response regulator CheB|uniref:Protein-glutamate methylesterase/protein-glutamine glutaminase n=1 Tax=Xanthomonas graminis pv. graminis TaxID=134874 RepID=A0A1M4J925_9XANT|nr:chemotaxis response regulator protein-glutamate methylesterase [Xanthomonas translucens]AVY66864.1 chemotaxis protein [Xanthomonas translucens pv. undulosa]EKU24716.1 chemotaxis-specific protein-glutamate methylesterase [Xanthomonas translucens pv. graminis ART-Xtg29]ELQ17036.1 chemotaxis-specific methylesterase [Xanthomonas translucens DAR61454]MBC3972558.1 chemotaxis response regulator protein-glutamate methylesterase [Xanthomonas translucens pv. undulosa]MCT8281034.1 chemotaxis response 